MSHHLCGPAVWVAIQPTVALSGGRALVLPVPPMHLPVSVTGVAG